MVKKAYFLFILLWGSTVPLAAQSPAAQPFIDSTFIITAERPEEALNTTFAYTYDDQGRIIARQGEDWSSFFINRQRFQRTEETWKYKDEDGIAEYMLDAVSYSLLDTTQVVESSYTWERLDYSPRGYPTQRIREYTERWADGGLKFYSASRRVSSYQFDSLVQEIRYRRENPQEEWRPTSRIVYTRFEHFGGLRVRQQYYTMQTTTNNWMLTNVEDDFYGPGGRLDSTLINDGITLRIVNLYDDAGRRNLQRIVLPTAEERTEWTYDAADRIVRRLQSYREHGSPWRPEREDRFTYDAKGQTIMQERYASWLEEEGTWGYEERDSFVYDGQGLQVLHQETRQERSSSNSLLDLLIITKTKRRCDGAPILTTVDIPLNQSKGQPNRPVFQRTVAYYKGNNPCVTSTAEKEAPRFSFYPNPARSFLVVQPHGIAGTGATLSIFDVQGRVVRPARVWRGNQPEQFNLEGLPVGTYMLHYRDGPIRQTKPFIKQD